MVYASGPTFGGLTVREGGLEGACSSPRCEFMGGGGRQARRPRGVPPVHDIIEILGVGNIVFHNDETFLWLVLERLDETLGRHFILEFWKKGLGRTSVQNPFFEVVTDREWWIREHAPIDLFEKKIVMTFGAAKGVQRTVTDHLV